ncbi:unnamed protein product [Cunninghamella blakesleeana]
MDNLGSSNDSVPNENENFSTAIKSIFVNGYSNASREFEKFCTFWRFTDRPRNNMSPTLKEGATNSDRSISFDTMNKDEMNINHATTSGPNKNDTYEQNNKSQGAIYERIIPDSHRYQGKQKRTFSFLMGQNEIGTDNHPSSLSLINADNDGQNSDDQQQQHLKKRVRYIYELNNEPTVDSLINKGKRSVRIDDEQINSNNNIDHSTNQNSQNKKIKMFDLSDDDGNTTHSHLHSLTNRKPLSSTTTPTTPTPTINPPTPHTFLIEDTTTNAVHVTNDDLRKDREEKLLSLSSMYPRSSTSSSPHGSFLRTSRQYNFNYEESTSTFNLLSLEDERLKKLEDEVQSLQSQINKFADSPFILQSNKDHHIQSSLLNKEKNKQVESPSRLTKSSKYQWPPLPSASTSAIYSGKGSANDKTIITKTPLSYDTSQYSSTLSLDTTVTSPVSVNIPTKKQQHPVLTSTLPIIHNDKKSFFNDNNNNNTLPSVSTVHIPKTSPKIKQPITTNTNIATPNNNIHHIDNNNNNTKINSDKIINENHININDGINDTDDEDMADKNKKYSVSPPMYRSPNPINFTPSRLPSYYQKTPLTLSILSPSPPPPPPLPTTATAAAPLSFSPLGSSTKYNSSSSSMAIKRPILDLNEIKNHRLVQKQSSSSSSTSSSPSKPLTIDEKIVSQRKPLEIKTPILLPTSSTSTKNILKHVGIEENHKKFMDKLIQQIPQVNLRKTDMIRGPDGELQQNPIWFEIYKHRR